MQSVKHNDNYCKVVSVIAMYMLVTAFFMLGGNCVSCVGLGYCNCFIMFICTYMSTITRVEDL